MAKTTLKEIKNLVCKNREKFYQDFSITNNTKQPTPTMKENFTDSYIMSNNESNTSVLVDSILSSENDMINDIFSYPTISSRSPAISSETEKWLKNVEGKFAIRELSIQLNISAPTLYYWAKKNHYHPKNGSQHSPISYELKEKLLKQLDSMSIAELARIYAIPYHKLYHWIKKHGLTTKKTSEFPPHLQQELRDKCRTFSLKDLAQEYQLTEQTMRSRLQKIGCFSDGKGGFFIVNHLDSDEILHCYQKKGIEETAKNFCTTKIAMKSFLKKYRCYLPTNPPNNK